MRIAYMILAHGNYKHLQRLIDALQYPGVSFYVHIDKKSEMPTINGSNIFFVKRTKVYWSSFGEVKATLNLIKTAIKHNNDRYVLLSGMDYPIRSNEEIVNRFANDSEFVYMTEYSKGVKPLSFIQNYYFNNIDRRGPNSFKKKILTRLERISRILKIKKKIPFEIYQGTQWFALTKNCVNYILSQIENDSRYIRFFKNSRFPCETFFLTIIAGSDFKNKIMHDLPYTDWTKPIKPAIIDASYIELFKQEIPYLFARKFKDESVDVISKIDEQLRFKKGSL